MLKLSSVSGVSWSSGIIHHPWRQGSKVRTPVLLFLFLEKNRKTTNGEPARRDEKQKPRRSGERRRRTGRRIRNGYEKGFGSFRKRTIKWSTPKNGLTWREKSS